MQGTLSSNVALPVDALAQQRRRAIIATVLGNGLEWFDFTVYSFFAVIIARLFFPTGNELSSLLLAVATFGVGFFMRPVGGIVLGATLALADHKGIQKLFADKEETISK